MAKIGDKELQRMALKAAQADRSAAPRVKRKVDTGGLIAPDGECVYCDRRRAKTTAKVAAWRAAKAKEPKS